ncbi:YafY family protein [Prevotella sp. P6B1]|uniref:helix-turn-helix transcriptional regulator n=1 Tax=Prevotella sp. P6B1 TaxID=1410613 RepID=UPI00051B1736|nr:WYL domain-containing protein [Prevotella sp. P6B1]
MRPAQIFHQYIWIIHTLSRHGELTFEELSQKWCDDRVAEGNLLVRSSFNRHRDAIADMFGIDIRCTPNTYRYYIANPSRLGDDSLERWMFSTLAVHGVLSDSMSIKDRVVLESVPAGVEFLATIIQAIKLGRKILMRYQRFGAESYDKVVEPYAIKLFRQRWYLLSFTGRHYAIYALDRMQDVQLTDESFLLPEGFSAQDYFGEYYGVMTTDEPLTHLVVRAHRWAPNYLRTLPLHHSQRELQSGTLPSGAAYTDFSFDIRPTVDFLGELLSHGDGIEVLEPEDVRLKMMEMIDNARKWY